jgi:hypothetical protein
MRKNQKNISFPKKFLKNLLRKKNTKLAPNVQKTTFGKKCTLKNYFIYNKIMTKHGHMTNQKRSVMEKTS